MEQITTERLNLRPFQETDAQAMFKNWTYDERVARYCRWHPHQSIEETKAYLQMCLDHQYCWAITLKGKDEPIGCIEVVNTPHPKTAEIGYVLMAEQWGKGIMTEALKAVMERLFQCGFDVIEACHDVRNPASGKVMKKCGMTFVKTQKALRKFGSDELCDVLCYEIHGTSIESLRRGRE